ncbi:MAG TPA: cupin domain-containing protein [Gemmatimonadaceae bacterium]|nr:cupin domain-containing protein [Gemmatimonadaceae bacterium]
MMQITTTRGDRLLLLVIAVLVGTVIGVAVDRTALAQPPGIKRTILLRADDPANPAYEAVVGVAEISPGASAGRHRHFGIEVGYVLEGSVTVEPEGRPAATLTAGQAFKNDAGVHNAKNPGSMPTKILAVYIVEKGKPLAEPVP